MSRKEIHTEEIPLSAIDESVGGRIRARRELLQMTNEWLAGILQISSSELADIEEGRKRIGHQDLMLVAELLDVPERYFYLGLERKAPTPDPSPSWVREVDRWFAANLFPHEGLLLSVARRLTGNTDTARDIVHDIYADFVAGDKWKAISNPRAYAVSAVRNVAGRRLQRSRIVPIELVANMEAMDHVDMTPDAHEVLSAKERRLIVLQAIDDLPPQCRKVVKLRRLKEMLPREIALEMGISVSMVEKHLAKGMAIIADRLGAHEPTPPKSEEIRKGRAASE